MSDNKKYASQRRKGTKTSSFGAPGRVGHDSTKFYSSKLYQGQRIKKPVRYIENKIDSSVLDKVFCKSSEVMEEVPDYSVHLMVTSPPYNVTKEYDEDLSLDEYRLLLKNVMKEVYRVLVPGGRACVNIANVGRKPYIPLHSYIIKDMLDIGFLMRGEVIWDKASSAGTSTAWGSWKSASNPTLRDVHEYIMIFSKEDFSRKKVKDRKDTIKRDEFLELTKSIWSFKTEPAKRVGHPAPFPIELPYRLIQLYTFEGEIVLDPFCGSGQACIAAIKSDRHYIGYDTEEKYVKLAERRIKEFTQQQLSLGEWGEQQK